ncbi:uncharacterized protein LOC115764457 isoform X2 [Drosophila novamexicana]|nr:uncharacterized protein LOC115764457 isoform X2 [Drosophila novamexicana]
MLFRRCCCCFPLRYGSLIIGIVFTCLFFAEMAFHGEQCVFIYTKTNEWNFLQSIILTTGIISSLMLIYGAFKEKRCLLIVWMISFLIIFVLYLVMFILDIVLYHYSIEGLSMQVIILLSIALSLMFVHSHFRELSS